MRLHQIVSAACCRRGDEGQEGGGVYRQDFKPVRSVLDALVSSSSGLTHHLFLNPGTAMFPGIEFPPFCFLLPLPQILQASKEG